MTDDSRIHCPRIEQLRVVQDHLACPYCHGRAADVASADHGRFCDYDPLADPVVYGFPSRCSRLRTG